ncbi:MAG: hypothetical protein KDD19_24915 [Phaeodactylibacter sp.]|nr:hypothetical protein [Phaeodactylibacter sp.]
MSTARENRSTPLQWPPSISLPAPSTATTFALFFEFAQGGRFTYTYSGDINNDGSGLNDLIYIPTESDLQQMQFSGSPEEQAAQRTALSAFIQQDEYLN